MFCRMMFVINNDTFDQCHGKCGQFLEDLVFYKETEGVNKYLSQISFVFKQTLGLLQLKKILKILEKTQKESGIFFNVCFYFQFQSLSI